MLLSRNSHHNGTMLSSSNLVRETKLPKLIVWCGLGLCPAVLTGIRKKSESLAAYANAPLCLEVDAPTETRV